MACRTTFFRRPAPRPSRHQIDTSDLTACSMEECLYARVRAVGRCFFSLFAFSHPIYQRQAVGQQKLLDETPESDQEVVSERREMSPPPYGKTRRSIRGSSFSSAPTASTTTVDPSPLRRLVGPVTDGAQQAVFHMALRV